jgi:hypothetical protein
MHGDMGSVSLRFAFSINVAELVSKQNATSPTQLLVLAAFVSRL